MEGWKIGRKKRFKRKIGDLIVKDGRAARIRGMVSRDTLWSVTSG